MKRLIFISLCMFVVSLLCISQKIFAASSYTVNLSITVDNGEVVAITNTSPYGNNVDLGRIVTNRITLLSDGTAAMKRVVTKNIGNVAIDLSLSGTSGTLTITTNAPSTDQIRLWGHFVFWNTDIQGGAALETGRDCITIISKMASATVFANNSDADSVKGFNIGQGSEASLKFAAQAGSSSTPGNSQSITLSVVATKH